VTPLDIQVSSLGRHALVTVWGELDVTNAQRLTDRLTALIGEGGGDTGLIVHLAELEFCDTTGLSVFIAGARLAAEAGVPYLVAGAAGRVARVIHLTGLEQAPWLLPDLESAVLALHRDDDSAHGAAG
jgi:anti-sigma B factor antagonist